MVTGAGLYTRIVREDHYWLEGYKVKRAYIINLNKIRAAIAAGGVATMIGMLSITAGATEAETKISEETTQETTTETTQQTHTPVIPFEYQQNSTIKGTNRVVKTNLEGHYYASGVAGIAMTDQEWSLQKDAGMAMVEYFFVTTWDITQDTAPLAVKTFRIVADSEQAELGPVVQININKTFNGKMTSLEGNEAKFTTVVGLPDDFKGADYRYAVVLVRAGGYFDILPDLDDDDLTVTFKAKAGNGAYALIRYKETNG